MLCDDVYCIALHLLLPHCFCAGLQDPLILESVLRCLIAAFPIVRLDTTFVIPITQKVTYLLMSSASTVQYFFSLSLVGSKVLCSIPYCTFNAAQT